MHVIVQTEVEYSAAVYIAAIVYYLTYARYLSNIFKPAEILSEMF